MTEKALAVKEDMALNVADIKKYICPSATDKELFMFLGIARSYGLNPLKREIHFVKYGNNPASIIVGYEVYLKRAEATGKLGGWKCWIEKDEIGEKAVIEIKRTDQEIPIRWEVYRKEFDRQQATWKTMPMFLLKKVAISQGFRLAFPGDLGGMPYTAEEMPHEKGGGVSEQLPPPANGKYSEPAEVVEAQEEDVPPFDEPFGDEPVKVISEAQQKRLFAKAKAAGWPTAELKAYLSEVHGIMSSKTIPVERYDKIIEWVDSHTGYAPKEGE